MEVIERMYEEEMLSTSILWVWIGGAECGDIGAIKKTFVSLHREEPLS